MTSHHSDILLPPGSWGPPAVTRSRFVAFVPITLALLGIGAIIFGGISVRDPSTNISSLTTIDPVTTGSIATPDARRRALEMLDR